MSNTGKNILIVDDNPNTLEIIQRNLKETGCNIFLSSNVEDAIIFLKENNCIDLVITDNKMPKINGTELVRYIRENYHEIEVIMITGYPSIPGAIEAIRIGAGEYLTKPFTSEELV
ncbi:response regulator, partial [bacterium]|nr:response regulator [bacterium]